MNVTWMWHTFDETYVTYDMITYDMLHMIIYLVTWSIDFLQDQDFSTSFPIVKGHQLVLHEDFED